MTLIVEDGTGKADAEAYQTVAEFRAHCEAYGLDLTGKTDAQCEIALRKALAFIDTIYRYKGTRLSAGQAAEFPRAGCTDWSGFVVTGVPQRVKRASGFLGHTALSEELYTDLDRGGMVTSESVGPISTSYAPDAPVGKTFRQAEQLLKPLVREAKPSDPIPFFSTSEAPSFEPGGMDNEGSGTYGGEV